MNDNDEEETIYFLDTLNLLYDHQWLYKFPVTNILVEDFSNEFPIGWLRFLEKLNVEELNELVVRKITKTDWPETFRNFVEKCASLDKLSRVKDREANDLPQTFKNGLSDKKQHEIVRLANLVHEQCAANEIDTIVDLGSGLGYVCQLLHFLYNYKVLGLESNENNVRTAKIRQKKFYPSSLTRVKYFHEKITIDSSNLIEKYLNESFDERNPNFCLIGLHACSDLGVDACKLFDKISSAKIFITMSCCYHKIEQSRSTSDKILFRNFPISKTLKNIVETSKRDYREILQKPFLRLACQEPAERWIGMNEESHRRHSFHVLARAVLELFVQRHSIILRKRVRKATRLTQCENFETYLDDVFLRYDFFYHEKEIKIEPSEIRDEILSTWHDNSCKMKAAEIYTGLQLIMQSTAESLVLNDRRCWLMEMCHQTEIIPVTSRTISPRSHAIVSKKKIFKNK